MIFFFFFFFFIPDRSGTVDRVNRELKKTDYSSGYPIDVDHQSGQFCQGSPYAETPLCQNLHFPVSAVSPDRQIAVDRVQPDLHVAHARNSQNSKTFFPACTKRRTKFNSARHEGARLLPWRFPCETTL